MPSRTLAELALASNELDDGHVGTVALPRSNAHNAAIAPGPRRVARHELVHDLFHHVAFKETALHTTCAERISE